MRKSPRHRRLANDWKALLKLQDESTIFRLRQHGNPPEAYDMYFDGIGVSRRGETVEPQRKHHVEVRLGMTYPCVMPELRWKTPIFHPNISAGGAVCLGGYQTHWVPSLDLAEMAEMLWDMIRYANYDVTSPYNRDAARWAHAQSKYPFPLDDRPLRDKIASQPRPSRASRQVAEDEIVMAEVVEVVDAEIVQPRDTTDVFFID